MSLTIKKCLLASSILLSSALVLADSANTPAVMGSEAAAPVTSTVTPSSEQISNQVKAHSEEASSSKVEANTEVSKSDEKVATSTSEEKEATQNKSDKKKKKFKKQKSKRRAQKQSQDQQQNQ